MRKTLRAALAAMVASLALSTMGPTVAGAQQMGTNPWAYPTHDRTFSAQIQIARKNWSGGDGTADLLIYNSSSTAIGNLNQITQILEQGASAYIDQNTDQASQGNQGSSAGASNITGSTVQAGQNTQ